MTKKDYVRIAAALATEKPFVLEPGKRSTFSAVFDQWKADVCALADTLAADNPRFDRARFLKACGVEG